MQCHIEGVDYRHPSSLHLQVQSSCRFMVFSPLCKATRFGVPSARMPTWSLFELWHPELEDLSQRRNGGFPNSPMAETHKSCGGKRWCRQESKPT